MALGQALLPEFDHEMENTRKILERVPDGKFDWRPHEKSGTLGWLTTHVATIPGWTSYTIGTDRLDIADPNMPPPPKANTRAEALSLFDKAVAEGRAALAAVSDADLMKPWSLVGGGKTIFTMPRIAVLRSMVMNHMIHHRAQLGVYLRLNDVALPAIYGPSADENPFAATA
jgi:uncharacterized damage-inducible protein DinB